MKNWETHARDRLFVNIISGYFNGGNCQLNMTQQGYFETKLSKSYDLLSPLRVLFRDWSIDLPPQWICIE